MATKIFVNLPVKDLKRSVTFFTRLGYTFNAQFTNENATSMIVSEDIYVMLLVEPFFKSFTKKEIPDTKAYAQSIIALSAESREEVDQLLGRAEEAGAVISGDAQDQGFMYVRGFEDPDGHLWEVMWMDPAAVQG